MTSPTVEEALKLLEYAIGPHLPLPQVRQLIADAMMALKHPLPIEAQGGEPLAAEDLSFAIKLLGDNKYMGFAGGGLSPDSLADNARIDRILAALTRPDPSLGGGNEMFEWGREAIAEAFRKGAMSALGCPIWEDADAFFSLAGMDYAQGKPLPSTMPLPALPGGESGT